MGQPQQLNGGLQRWHGGERGELRHRQGIEFHRGRSDDTQGAFRANHQVAQVVAGVVFAQARQTIPDFTLRGDHFQAETQLTGVAVAHHLRATGVRPQIATDGATALRGHTQREQQARGLTGLLHSLQYTAGIDGDGEVGRVQHPYLVHAGKAQHDLASAGIGCRTHHHAGVATLRYQADACSRTGFDHIGHLLGGRRTHHGECASAFALAPVHLPGAEVAFGEHLGFTHNLAQSVKKGIRGVHAGSPLKRRRTCIAQAEKSSRHNTISTIAK